jgi:hypothetical protein
MFVQNVVVHDLEVEINLIVKLFILDDSILSSAVGLLLLSCLAEWADKDIIK